jgi:hypothetical protein
MLWVLNTFGYGRYIQGNGILYHSWACCFETKRYFNNRYGSSGPRARERDNNARGEVCS